MRRISQNGLLIASLAGFAVACGSAKEERPAWACERVSIPMGQVVECTSTVASALVSNDGVSNPPITATTTTTTTTSTSDGSSGDGSSIFWECTPDSTSFLCPPLSSDGVSTGTSGSGGTDTSVGGGSGGTAGTDLGAGSVTGGGTGGTGTGGTGTGGTVGTGGTGTGGTGGTGTGGTGGGTGGTGTDPIGSGTIGGGGSGGTGGTGGTGGAGGSTGGGGNGGGWSGSVTPECEYAPTLTYCSGGPVSSDGVTGTGGGTGGTDGTGTTGNGNGNGNGGTNGNGSGGSGGTGGTGGTGSGDGTGTGGTGTGSGGTGGTGGNGSKGDGANGNPKGGGSTSSDGTSGGSTAGGGKGGPTGVKGATTCIEKDGKTTCREKTPQCAAGTKPAPCGACVPVNAPPSDSDCKPPLEGGCWITGGGWVGVTPVAGTNGKATFGGNGKPMKSGEIKGEWNHVDHTGGGHIHGKVRYLVCRRVDEPGPGNPSGPKKNFKDNQAYFGGPAVFAAPNGNMAEGYWFDAFVEDHGEPGNKPGPGNHGSGGPDEYRIVLRKTADPSKNQSGTIVYSIKQALPLGGGNIQLHPPNGGHPATASSLPQWVSYEP